MNTPRLRHTLAVILTSLSLSAVRSAGEGPTDAKGPVVLPSEVINLPVEQAILTAPPHVPPPTHCPLEYQ